MVESRWQRFIQAPQHDGDRELTHEFYINLAANRGDLVYLRGQQIDISVAAINRHYQLPDYPEDPYLRLLQDGIDRDHLTFTLTGERHDLAPDWRRIDREKLTPATKVWYYFVAARLMPTVTNSQVRKERALLTYAIMRGVRIDVGRVIHQEIMAALETKRCKWSLGFPGLIYSLAIAAGVDPPSSTSSRLQPRKIISLDLYHQPQPPQRARHPEPSDDSDDDDDDADDDTGDDVPEPSRSQPVAGCNFGQRMDALEQQIVGMSSRFQTLETQMTSHYDALQTQMASGFETMQQYLADLAARFPPPPLVIRAAVRGVSVIHCYLSSYFGYGVFCYFLLLVDTFNVFTFSYLFC